MAVSDERKKLTERYKVLPPEVKQLFFNTEIQEKMLKIGAENKLSEKQVSSMVGALGFALLGVLEPNKLLSRLQEDLGVDGATVAKLIGSIDRQILSPVQKSLQRAFGDQWLDALRKGIAPDVTKLAPSVSPPPPLRPPAPFPPPRPIVLQPLPQQARPLPPLAPPPLAPLPRPAIPLSPPRPVVPPAWPAPSFAKALEGKPPVPLKPILRPTPPPPVTEAEAGLTLERMLVGLPPELRSAVKNIPLRRIIYDLGREHRMTIEEIGQLADGVLKFIAGKIHREDLLRTLARLLKDDRAKAAAASEELNAKVFGPIRAAMKQATAPPPVVSRVEPPPPPLQPPTPSGAKKLEPLIIYPLSMARPPVRIMGQEPPMPKLPVAQQIPGTPTTKPPSAAPPAVSPSTPLDSARNKPLGAGHVEPPVVSRIEPPPTLPVYEEVRDKGEPPKPAASAGELPPLIEPHGPDPYRESVE